MFIAGVIVICVVLFLLALLAPRLARKPHAATNRTLGTGAAAASRAPGFLGRWLPKPFRTSQKATNRSTAAGSKAHRKIAEKL
jgi:predicted permease